MKTLPIACINRFHGGISLILKRKKKKIMKRRSHHVYHRVHRDKSSRAHRKGNYSDVEQLLERTRTGTSADTKNL